MKMPGDSRQGLKSLSTLESSLRDALGRQRSSLRQAPALSESFAGRGAWQIVLLALLLVVAFPAGAQVDRYQGEQIDAALVGEMEDARSQRRAGQYDEAIERLTALVEQQPDYYLAWYNLGLAQAQSGAPDDGAVSLEKALELKETHDIPDTTIYNSVGWTHYLRGDYEAAKPVLEKAIAQEGISERSRTRALNNLGSVLLRLQEFEQAKTTLEKATELGSTRAQVNLKVLDTAKSVSIRQRSLDIKKETEGGGG